MLFGNMECTSPSMSGIRASDRRKLQYQRKTQTCAFRTVPSAREIAQTQLPVTCQFIQLNSVVCDLILLSAPLANEDSVWKVDIRSSVDRPLRCIRCRPQQSAINAPANDRKERSRSFPFRRERIGPCQQPALPINRFARQASAERRRKHRHLPRPENPRRQGR